MKRFLLWASTGLLIIEVIYVLGAAVFLNLPQGLNRLLTSDPSLIHHHRFAWSWFPGYLHVWGLKFGVQDSTMQLYFTARKATLWINLSALRRKEFHAANPQLHALEFFFRSKSSTKSLDVAAIRSLPVLPNFRPLPSGGPERAPEDRWKVRLDNLRAPNAQVWFDQYRFRGEASIKGGFFLHTGGHRLEVAPTRITFQNGALSVGPEKIVTDWRADIEAKLSMVEPRHLKDLDIFRSVDATVDTDAQVRGFALLNYLLQDLNRVSFSDGESRVKAKVKIRAGKVESTSRVTLRTDRVSLRLWESSLSGDIEMDSFFEDGVPTLKARIGRFGLRFSPDGPVAIRGKDLRLKFRTPQLDLARPLRPISLRLQMPTARLANLARLNHLLPRGGVVKFVEGEAQVETDFTASSASKETDFGSVRLRAKKARLSIRDRLIEGDLRLNIPFAKSKFSEGAFDVSGTRLKLQGFASESEPGWWMNVVLNRAQWNLGKAASGKADVHVEARDLRPLLNVFLSAQNVTLPGFIKNLLSFENLRAKTRIEADDESLEITGFEATSENTHLWGWLKENPMARDGQLLVQVGPFAAGLEIQDKNVSLRLNDAFAWYRR